MNHSLTQTLKLGLALMAGLFLSACRNHKPAFIDAASVGTYALVSVNGTRVPAKVFHDDVALEVRSGSFTFEADGTCSTRTVFVPPSGTEVSRAVGGTCLQKDSKLTLQWKGAGKTTGTIQGNTFIMENEGMVFVYEK